MGHRVNTKRAEKQQCHYLQYFPTGEDNQRQQLPPSSPLPFLSVHATKKHTRMFAMRSHAICSITRHLLVYIHICIYTIHIEQTFNKITRTESTCSSKFKPRKLINALPNSLFAEKSFYYRKEYYDNRGLDWSSWSGRVFEQVHTRPTALSLSRIVPSLSSLPVFQNKQRLTRSWLLASWSSYVGLRAVSGLTPAIPFAYKQGEVVKKDSRKERHVGQG